MILSNREVYAALDSGRIVLDPPPSPRLYQPGEASPFDTHSVDVRLAPVWPSHDRDHTHLTCSGQSEVYRFPSFWQTTRTDVPSIRKLVTVFHRIASSWPSPSSN